MLKEIPALSPLMQPLENRQLLSAVPLATVARPAANWLAVEDFNNDGEADIVTTRVGRNGGLCIRLGEGSNEFANPRRIGPTGFARGGAVAVADFDDDGNEDLAIYGGKEGRRGRTQGLRVLMGNGDGTFESAINVGGPTFSRGGSYGAGLALGDVDGDNNFDIVVFDPRLEAGQARYDALFLVSGNGDGTFDNAVTIG